MPKSKKKPEQFLSPRESRAIHESPLLRRQAQEAADRASELTKKYSETSQSAEKLLGKMLYEALNPPRRKSVFREALKKVGKIARKIR